MTKSVELLTREEKILLESVRSSGLPVKKLLNEINNVYRETEHQKAFSEGMRVLANEVTSMSDAVILASFFSQDYEEPNIYMVHGCNEEELIRILDGDSGDGSGYDVEEFIEDDYISPSPKEVADYIESKGYTVVRLPLVAYGSYSEYSAGEYKPSVEWDRDSLKKLPICTKCKGKGGYEQLTGVNEDDTRWEICPECDGYKRDRNNK
jgi:hypothetical protein